jgi:general secretion pathway protein M
MTALSRDFRRFVAVALLLAVAMLAHALVVEPILNAHKRLDAAWAESAVLLANYRRIAVASGSLGEIRSDLENDSSAAPAYLTTSSLTLAATELQKKLNATLARHKAQLIGTRVLEPVEEGAFQLVGMRVTLTAGLGSLQAVLYELESAVPLLFIDELAIQKQEARALRPGSPGATSAPDPQLDVSFNLLAYLRRNGS